MLDFVDVHLSTKGRSLEVVPDFKAVKSNDLMIRGRDFYAFYDEETGLWSKDIYRLIEIIDTEVDRICEENAASRPFPKHMSDYSTGVITKFNKYCKEIGNNYHDLDLKVIFSNTKVKKTDYATMRLSYPIEAGDISAYEELINVLYKPKEREKLEWAIGSIIAGDSKDIQKFIALYGESGTGKSTVFRIMDMIFGGYISNFRSKDLGSISNQFALEPLKDNKLIGVDDDGDLSKIEDNTRLNLIISHEPLVVNEKGKRQYSIRFRSMLFIGSNSPVRITDSKSGILRRLIDVSPTGNLIDIDRYNTLMNQISFETGAIADHCLKEYLRLGKNYYMNYIPSRMIDETNDMYNFVSEMLWEWDDRDYISLAEAWESYKRWCDDSRIPYSLKKSKFKMELKSYFKEFHPEQTSKGVNLYYGLKKDKFTIYGEKEEKKAKNWISMAAGIASALDILLANCKAQYATDEELPRAKWENVRRKLSEVDTSKLHYVKVPKHHIVIDFDLKNDKGEKDFILNLQAASKFPPTYAELSKSGSGIHLHYIYDGKVEDLSRIYDDDIEVKVFTGNSSLRRRLTKCNDIPVTTINGGLPLKPKKGEVMIDAKSVENERHLRALMKKCLHKENHGHTKPEVDFMEKILNEAYANETLSYDIRDMKPSILTFAMSSTNQAQAAYQKASAMKYCSKDHESEDGKRNIPGTAEWEKAPIVFFDVEVFPNLFVICWKQLGEEHTVTRMINPTPEEVKKLFGFRLVGFYNRRYDNHIVYARSQGYTNEELFRLSQKIIAKQRNAFFGEAYGLSYTDIWDYCSNANRMSLKKWEIKLRIFHLENQYPWDQPVPEEHWNEIADYCCNDVVATEAVWNATQADFRARQILAELSGLTVNDTSNKHTQQIIFGDDRNPQSQFNYPNLADEFPGYEFKGGKSYYMGEVVGEGGWVFSKPGIYINGKCEDVSGMHPHSVYAMQLFGPVYTERYFDLVRIRTYIKHGDYEPVKQMFDGRLAKYLGSEEEAKELSNALKTPINAVYGLTAAKFDNRCRDPRNVDNVVAKRGALFMITLKNEVEKRGYTVIHCKTDSIKLADPDDDILRFIEEFGKKYGYDFEIEDEFERICLVNDSTFIAINKATGQWQAKAAQFAHPYVFKSLFTHEDISFDDLCETKEVKVGAMYLDLNENLPDVTESEKELKKALKQEPIDSDKVNALTDDISKGHNYNFVGKVGLFTPVIEGAGGGVLLSSEDKLKYKAVTGTKEHRFLESETIKQREIEDKIDMSYFDKLADDAIANISKYGDFDAFVNMPHEEYYEYMRKEN